MNRFATALVGIFALGAPAAFAGGPVTVAPEPVLQPAAPIVVRTDGNWGGAYVGAHVGYGDVKIGSGSGIKGNGALGGIQAGYRWDLGTTVLGVEADYSASDVSFNNSAGSLDNVARLKLQAGYDLGNTLVYVTGGAAHAKAKIAGDSYSDTGYFAGLGVDYALNDKWTVGGEILAHRFDNFDSTGFDPDATTAAVRVNFRF